MNLASLHSLMNKKGYYYFEGHTNSNDNDLYISFSTLRNCRGDFVKIRIGEFDNDVEIEIQMSSPKPCKEFILNKANDNDFYKFIEKHTKNK